MSAGESAAALAIGSAGFKVSLLSVAPGREAFVARRMASRIRSETGSEPLCLLKLFGVYDVCAIYRTPDFLGGPSKAGSIDHIRGGNQILAFPWKTSDADKGLSVAKAHGVVWGLLFFRINEALASRLGVWIETVLARAWRSGVSDHVALDVFGTTGWAELLVVARGKRFKDVATALSRISQQQVLVRTPNGTSSDLFSAKTFSLFGIDFDLTLSKNRSKLLKDCNEPFNKDNGIFPVLTATCPPSSMKKINDVATKSIGPGSSTFGAADFIFEPRSTTWGGFIAAVLDMRKRLPQCVYSTSIAVLCSGGDVPFADVSPSQLIERKGLSVSRPRIDLFRKWGPIFEKRLINLYFGISNLMQDPLVGDCFADLRTTTETQLPELLAGARPEDEAIRKHVGEYIQAIAYGAEERLHGAFLTLERVGDHFSPTKGGIHRILKAASVIPKKLLGRVGLPWNGFMIAGYQNESFASITEIINLPFDSLFRPEEWWALFHEVGHVSFWTKGLVDIEDPKISALLTNVVDRSDTFQCDKWRNFIWEIGADAFDLLFCHYSDVDVYLSNIWSYITRDGRSFDDEHFVRYFIMFEYWKHLIRRGSRRFPRNLEEREEFESYVAKLRQLDLTCSVASALAGEAISMFRRLAPVVEFYHDRYVARAPTRGLSEELSSPVVRRALSSVMHEKVFTEPLHNPEVFILGLKRRKKELTLAARIAAIMTLWHTATISDAGQAKVPARRRTGC